MICLQYLLLVSVIFSNCFFYVITISLKYILIKLIWKIKCFSSKSNTSMWLHRVQIYLDTIFPATSPLLTMHQHRCYGYTPLVVLSAPASAPGQRLHMNCPVWEPPWRLRQPPHTSEGRRKREKKDELAPLATLGLNQTSGSLNVMLLD